MFHVPNQFRIREGRLATEDTAGNNGFFVMKEQPKPGKHPGQVRYLFVIASDGMMWEHVSIHAETPDHRQYTPRWDEMQAMKNLFWDEQDVVVQFHPAKDKYVNVHPNTLHLWRLRDGWEDFLPMPPKELVG